MERLRRMESQSLSETSSLFTIQFLFEECHNWIARAIGMEFEICIRVQKIAEKFFLPSTYK